MARKTGVTPVNAEAERSIISAILLDNDVFFQIEHLEPQAFGFETHQLVYGCIQDLLASKRTCDFVTLTEALHRSGDLERIGGPAFVTALMDFAGTTAGIEAYVEIVLDNYRKRQIHNMGIRLVQNSLDPATGADELISQAAKIPTAITQGLRKDAKASFIGARADRIEDERRLASLSGRSMTAKFGYSPIDEHLNSGVGGGVIYGQFTLVSGLQGSGKTTLMLNCACEYARATGEVVLYVATEDPEQDISLFVEKREFARWWHANEEIPPDELDFARCRPDVRQRMHDLPLAVEYHIMDPVQRVAATMRYYAREHGCRVVIIDRIEKLQRPLATRDDLAKEILLDAIAGTGRELGMATIAVCQLTGEIEKRLDKIPRPTDLKGGTVMEQDARSILFSHDPYATARTVMGEMENQKRWARTAAERKRLEALIAVAEEESLRGEGKIRIGIGKQKHGPSPLWPTMRLNDDDVPVYLDWQKPLHYIEPDRELATPRPKERSNAMPLL